MINRDSPVTEDELHAYIDGELPADRMEAVTTWLAAHPEQAVTVASWRAQSERIRARYGAILEEVVPERLTLDQVIRSDRANGRSWKIFAAAAALVAFFAGGATGWFAHGASVGTRTSSFAVANEALDAYKLYVVEVRHPVEVPGTERSAHDTMVVEAPRRGPTRARSAVDRPQARRRASAAGTDRSRRLLHV